MRSFCAILILLPLAACKPSAPESSEAHASSFSATEITGTDLRCALKMGVWGISMPDTTKTVDGKEVINMAIRFSYKNQDRIFYPFSNCRPGSVQKFMIWPSDAPETLNWCCRSDSGSGHGTRTDEAFRACWGFFNTYRHNLTYGDTLFKQNDSKEHLIRFYIGELEE